MLARHMSWWSGDHREDSKHLGLAHEPALTYGDETFIPWYS